MSEFRRIGPQVPYGETQVALGDVTPIHDIVAQDLVLVARRPTIEFNDERDSLQFSISLKAYDIDDDNPVHRLVTAQLRHESTPASWWLALSLRSFNMEERQSNKLVRYRFEVVGDELVEAKKAVYFVFGNSEIIVADNMPEERITKERKMYERPMVVDDCAAVVVMLERTLRRAQVS